MWAPYDIDCFEEKLSVVIALNLEPNSVEKLFFYDSRETYEKQKMDVKDFSQQKQTKEQALQSKVIFSSENMP